MAADGNAAGCEGGFAVLQRNKSSFYFLCGIVGGGALPVVGSGGEARTTAEEILAELECVGDRVGAGRQAFGDLGRFGETLKRYVRQAHWRAGVVLPGQAGSGGDVKVRMLAPAEVLALRGDFFVHRKRMDAARPLLEQGVDLGTEISATHEALGFFAFRCGDFAAADEEMSKAISLGSATFMAFYCHGVLLLRDLTETEESTRKAREML